MKRHGNVALITGGGGGLGKAFASALLEADVCSGIMLAEVNETLGRTAARELQQRFPDRRILSSRCDVANEQDIEDVINETDASLGKMTIMVNNAGIAKGGFNEYQKVITIDLVGVITGTKLAYEYMQRNSVAGTIVNIASYGGLVAMPIDPVYAAAKAGVIHFSRSCVYMKDDDIRVNVLCPSFADTPLVKNSLGGHLDEVVQGTLMTPKYVATAFLELVQNQEYAGDVMAVKPQEITVKGKGKIEIPSHISARL
eukprot:gb/GECG01007807.1/.p1 GENE.gb/GECG01007807.1/~~gb/GECG01007807.1/.p1  ORF type:complete len:256 (+),score=31.59 gb/GECG01007807.1/:1-768(+)